MGSKVRHLGVMLRVHHEHRWFTRIIRTLNELGRGRRLYVCVMSDRPNEEVRCRLPQLKSDLNGDVKIVDAPFPLVSDSERFMEALQIHYEELLAMGPIDAATLWDDDMWFSLSGRKAMCEKLDDFTWDRLYVRSAFLWDDKTMVNTKFPPHWQDLVFRVLPNDRYSTRLMQHAPQAVSARPVEIFKSCLLNAGYIDEDTRTRNWERYRKAGKVDAHTLTLVKKPALVWVGDFCDQARQSTES